VTEPGRPLAGRVTLVTGASRGIGRGIAVGLGEAGATVVITGRTIERDASGRSSTAELVEQAGGKALALRCDHRVDADVAAVFQRVEQEYGRLDLLVNNAAAFPPTAVLFGDTPFWGLDVERWDEQFDVTVRGGFVAAQHAARMMVREHAGLIVNLSSAGAQRKFGILPYGVAKAATDRMTADMAVELRDHGVAVVSLWPPPIATEAMIAGADETDDPAQWSEPVFVGRVVAALAVDPGLMARAGTAMRARVLAEELGVADVRAAG